MKLVVAYDEQDASVIFITAVKFDKKIVKTIQDLCFWNMSFDSVNTIVITAEYNKFDF